MVCSSSIFSSVRPKHYRDGVLCHRSSQVCYFGFAYTNQWTLFTSSAPCYLCSPCNIDLQILGTTPACFLRCSNICHQECIETTISLWTLERSHPPTTLILVMWRNKSLCLTSLLRKHSF